MFSEEYELTRMDWVREILILQIEHGAVLLLTTVILSLLMMYRVARLEQI